MRHQGEDGPHVEGALEKLTVRKVRSGCGIRMVPLPSSLHMPVMPPGEPFGLCGYCSVGLP